ncbi:TolC family protein [Ulvibacter antarcticus]|uniref:Outer membrane protein TolC n=1 Tax=Ulvibacter antarcticus TaxID=442714 RepID=A0A3L9Z4Y2_9FLAO|nr:TolC family protein [Ulvibacter antarcticus]RMA66519.1 outer membrane protein TolC [Ulvibacter antarcticus]
MRINLITCLALFVVGVSNAQQLEKYIGEALTRNPELKALEKSYEIASEKVIEVNTLPNTEFSAGYFVSEPETRTGAQKARFSVKQMIPWFGTITARENYVSSLADTQYIDSSIAKRKLTLAVTQSFYKLVSNQEKQQILVENIELLETYEKLALTSVEVGNASAVDVLKLQIRQNELMQKMKILQQDFLSERVAFNLMLNRDENLDIETNVRFEIPSEAENINVEILEIHPELLKFDKMYKSVETSELVNQKETGPNLGFGLDYIPVAERPDMDMIDNGKDIIMPMVSISIPIFNKKYKSVSRQNELRQQEITSQKENKLNTLKTLLNTAIANRMSAEIMFDIQSVNLKQAKDAEEILIKNYETGVIDFNDILDIQELQLKFEMDLIGAVQEYYLQSAVIYYLAK